MQSNSRITKLDGLRGLMSVMVALNHSFLVLTIPSFANVWGQNYFNFYDFQSKIQQIFMVLGNGGVAVTLFFLLSGLVLGQSLNRIDFTFRGLSGFFSKRLIRLYPVYIFLILLTAVYMKLGYSYQVFPPASSWFNWWMNFEMTLKEFILNLFFYHIYLGGVTWTLRVIIVASFLFPLLFLLNKKTSKMADLLITLLLIYLNFTVLNIPDFRDFRYLYMFYAGLFLPKFKPFFLKIPGKLLSCLLIPLVFLLLVIRYQTDEYTGGIVETAIGWLLMGLVVYHPTHLFDFLNKPLLLFFGKISYSLYLINFSAIYFLSRAMFIYLPYLPYKDNYVIIHLAIFFLALSISTFLSIFVYRFVEEPSLHLSKKAGLFFQKK